jgi:hypothetical protein
MRRNTEPKNCAEKFARKKKMGQVLQLKMESRKLLRFEMKKSITSFAADLILNHHDHTCAPWHCGSVRH